ncbi:hypothetical protein HOLleu_44074 [Holothuria leucospilota]|uniref:Uncharacterized protein n=1 Tax=Holothuria leucospilota TaxID=206669 RepID=A0A9Q0Y923_HOLLE|nr:hypothetical protein HOLleu_44074 [Holothuria leucospilota]
MHLFRGEHSQALQMIQEEKTKFDDSSGNQVKIRVQLGLQQASCHFICGQYMRKRGVSPPGPQPLRLPLVRSPRTMDHMLHMFRFLR